MKGAPPEEMHSVQLGRDKEHHGLRPIPSPIDTAHGAHVLRGCMVLTIEDVEPYVGSCGGGSKFGRWCCLTLGREVAQQS